MRYIKTGDSVRVLANTLNGSYPTGDSYPTHRSLRVGDIVKIVQGPFVNADRKAMVAYHCFGKASWVGGSKLFADSQVILLQDVVLLGEGDKIISINAIQSLAQAGTNSFIRSKKA